MLDFIRAECDGNDLFLRAGEERKADSANASKCLRKKSANDLYKRLKRIILIRVYADFSRVSFRSV